ncbi:ATP-binding response regulator [Endozoicomonas ascidiicola]|uniref:ATP-binding response regulator n=1 Tax=Endozoicomonas ascidiicola TaxID=1698521 RepID=UPI000835A712|nr:ATP-binding protein [Endozoicomonas ascidiicola]
MDGELWKKRYEREKQARLQAEQIAEQKTREIYQRNRELTQLAESLEHQVEERTAELEANNQRLADSRNTLRQKQTALKEANLRLQEKAAELEKVSEHKSQFLANVSHELRTPLNSLMILASMLTGNHEGNLSDDQLQSLQIIYNSANELLEIIEDILDMSKAEAGELSIYQDDVLLGDIWRGLYDQFMPISKERKIEFQVVCAPKLPDLIHTDKKRLKQILKNLLSNAFKFTPENGSVCLRIHKKTWRLDDQYTSEGLVFDVSDDGVGIAADKHETIFNLFKQADGSTSRRYGGTGLGLSISRKLTHLLGGQLSLDSEAGKGATFSLTLPPLTLVPQSSAGAQSDSNFVAAGNVDTTPDFCGQEVLLVDDDLRNSFAFSRLLESKGLKVHLAENAHQAIDFLNQSPPLDLILLDLMMPEVDGYELLTQLKSQDNFREIPAVMLTASPLREDEIRCREAGADDYLQKPIEVSVLINHINNVFLSSRHR